MTKLSNGLSARWTYSEKEGISTDKLGRGDITSWAKPITGFKRPEVGQVPHKSQKITNLAHCVMKKLEVVPWDSNSVCKPGDNKVDPTAIMARRAEILVKVAAKQADFFATKRVKKGKVIKIEKAVDPLADCPTIGPEEFKKLKAQSQSIEREVEPYSDDALHREQPTKKDYQIYRR